MSDFALDRNAIERFHQDGVLGPFEAVSPDAMAPIRAAIEDHVLGVDDGPQDGVPVHDRHRDHPAVAELATHPAIIDRMASIYGPDLLLWATHFWDKPPGGAEIPWHQDGNFWAIEPPLTISAWVAIDHVTVENACVNVIPGSHRERLPHVPAPPEAGFEEMADPATFDPDAALRMELAPGEFFLFTERTLHQSNPNESNRRRLGMSMRVTVPFVSIDHETLYDGHRATVVAGEDWQGINDTEPPLDRSD